VGVALMTPSFLSALKQPIIKIMKPEENKKSFRDFLINSKRVIVLGWKADKRNLILLAILSILESLFALGMTYSYKLLIDELIQVQGIAGAIGATLISILAFRYILDFVSDFRSSYANNYIKRIFERKLSYFLQLQFTKQMSELDMAHFENSETQDLINRTRQNYSGRIPFFVISLIDSLDSLFGFISAFVILFSFKWWVPFIILISAGVRFWIGNKFSKIEWGIFSRSTPESKMLFYLVGILESQHYVKELRIGEAINGILKRIEKLQDVVFERAEKPMWQRVKYQIIPSFWDAVAGVGLFFWQLTYFSAGLITVGQLTFFVSILERLSTSAGRLAMSFIQLYDSNLYIDYYFQFMDLPRLIKEKDPGHVFAEIKPPRIEFQNVSFAYPDGPKVLRNVSFVVEPGEHLAIVGPNGAGKSTLIKLLLRIYDPDEGQILIDGYDLRDLRLNHWYKFVGTLFQDFSSFHLSVRDNIMLGKSKKGDEERMVKAAKAAGAAEFIEALDGKYDQMLGKHFEGGVDLSGGQWQALAIARALYEDAPILILDEPTSAIDAKREAHIFENLHRAYKDKILIFVSHRFSTVRRAKNIIVLQNGKVKEMGDHKTLMELNGTYADLFNLQAKAYSE
jgi:ATP-binding cassette, subfamily B, bacterial